MKIEHTYTLSQRRDGYWGTWCVQCSAEDGQYVYPCKVGTKETPPPVLIEYRPLKSTYSVEDAT